MENPDDGAMTVAMFAVACAVMAAIAIAALMIR